MKGEGDAIIVPIDRPRGLGRTMNLHPQAQSKSGMEQGLGRLHAAPRSLEASLGRRKAVRASSHTKDLGRRVTLPVFGLHRVFGLVETSPGFSHC